MSEQVFESAAMTSLALTRGGVAASASDQDAFFFLNQHVLSAVAFPIAPIL
jgi:hypothetical protein